ncbi:hypothetical protein DENIS_1905 [Desulfonema ishimotonii]|uniref:Uncharacterized protein n=1 Tax=Desulfonema ishimotonii TaxID=45657 RepID=A0A401FVF5_9BACT|nr:radical SAM protein [Desulfonema ishimotonii]GBC60945.1 hypothetical protein DENIS_1905 [Desulfonema ishimotonii]
MKTACIAFAQGCPRSRLDAALLMKYFRVNQWGLTNNLREADMILVATCGFTAEHEDKSINFLAIAERKKKPDARIVAFGCLPGINRQRIVDEFDIKIDTVTRSAFGELDRMTNAEIPIEQVKVPNDLSLYNDYLSKSFSKLEKLVINYENPIVLARDIRDKIREKYAARNNGKAGVFYLRIATGCNGLCTYCGIKNATGALKSKPLDDVMNEFREGLAQGYTDFRLIAEDVGAYGQDNGTNIICLLRELFNNNEHFTLDFADFSPKWLVRYFPGLFNIFTRNKKRLGVLGLPVQSGSEKVLGLMKREYSAEDTRKCLSGLQKAAPDLRLDTHVLIGFPGEDEADFGDTLNYIRDIPFNQIFVYKYSDRPGAQSVGFPNKISEKVKRERIRRIEKGLTRSDLFIDYNC